MQFKISRLKQNIVIYDTLRVKPKRSTEKLQEH